MIDDVSGQKRATAIACYNYHRRRLRLQPRFLRRNLRQVLDAHDRLLRGPSAATPLEDMTANEKRHWGWDFPTTAMLEDFMNGHKPVLQLTSLRIRLPGSKNTIEAHPQEHTDDETDLKWLPHPQTDATWSCSVTIAVSMPKDAQNSKRSLHHERLPATIVQRSQDDGSPYFDVKLNKPFFFSVDKLFVVTESGKNGSRSWKRTATAPYVLDIAIQCQDSDDTLDLLAAIEGKDASTYHPIPSSEGLLRATWEQLPKCPTNGQLLPLRRAKGHKSIILDYQLETAMGWLRNRDYVLKRYNRANAFGAQPIRQLPTPSASDDMEKSSKRYDIAWNFKDGLVTRSLPLKTLACALCQDSREYARFGYLMLHCKRDHDHFDFEVEDVVDKPESQVVRATITLSATPPRNERLSAGEDKDLNWVAPNRPFDLKAYLHGEDDWMGERRTKAKKGPSRAPKEREVIPARPAPPSRKRPAPEDVEDLPVHVPKKHRVPVVQGVTFYRTTSKQQIEPGSYIAESDDEVDESWLAQRQDIGLQNLGITGAAKDFTRAFDRHLATEQSDSSILTRDALVRFVRKHKDQLKDVEWQRLFRSKLKQLQGVGVISEDLVSYCVGSMQAATEDTGPGNENDDNVTAGANRDSSMRISERRSAQPLERVKATNGTGLDAQDVRNGSRSISPSSARLAQRERRVWTGGKTVLRDSASANGAASPEMKDSGKGTPELPNPPSAPTALRVRRRLCFCEKPATDMRGTIACADPRCTRKDFHLACVRLERRPPGWRCADCTS